MVDAAFVFAVVGTGMGILIGMGALVVTLHIHISSQIKAIQCEMKDFHGRLCAIEEKRNRILMGER